MAATFRPRECLIGPALYLARAYYHRACVLSSAAKGLGVNLVVLVMLRTPGKKLSTSSVCRCSREQRRALKMLADAPTGVSEEVLVVAYGFSAEMLSGLVLAALARVVSETRTVRRGFTIKVERYRITDDGRRALEG